MIMGDLELCQPDAVAELWPGTVRNPPLRRSPEVLDPPHLDRTILGVPDLEAVLFQHGTNPVGLSEILLLLGRQAYRSPRPRPLRRLVSIDGRVG